MKKPTFSQAKFLLSTLSQKDYPQLKNDHGDSLPEIAFVGRSNVGKSSLLNHLIRSKKMAKVSASPGKTQTLNFFLLDEQIVLVDLPGFGYARTSNKTQEKWAIAIEEYLSLRKNLKLIIQLIDIRHPPSKQDIQFFEWAIFNKLPLCLVFTKKDKIKKTHVPKHIKEILSPLSAFTNVKDLYSLPYTIKESDARKSLIHFINNQLFPTKKGPEDGSTEI